MSCVFLSETESKLRMIFNMYDFDNDGKVSKEDVRILMSYVPFKQLHTNVDANSPMMRIGVEGLYGRDEGKNKSY